MADASHGCALIRVNTVGGTLVESCAARRSKVELLCCLPIVAIVTGQG